MVAEARHPQQRGASAWIVRRCNLRTRSLTPTLHGQGPGGGVRVVARQIGQRAKAHVAFGRSFVPVHPHRTVYELRRNGGRVATDIPHAVAGGLCFCRVALGTTPNWHPGPSGSADVAQKSRPKFKAVLVRGRLNLTPQPMNNSYAKG
jgi:hypothetical protein